MQRLLLAAQVGRCLEGKVLVNVGSGAVFRFDWPKEYRESYPSSAVMIEVRTFIVRIRITASFTCHAGWLPKYRRYITLRQEKVPMPRRLKLSPLHRDIVAEAGAETIGTVLARVNPSDEIWFCSKRRRVGLRSSIGGRGGSYRQRRARAETMFKLLNSP